MNIKNTIIEHYKKFFDLHAKGIALDEDDHLNIDWAEALVKDCFVPNSTYCKKCWECESTDTEIYTDVFYGHRNGIYVGGYTETFYACKEHKPRKS